MNEPAYGLAARLDALRQSSKLPSVAEAAVEPVQPIDMSPSAVRARLEELRALWMLTVFLHGRTG